MPKPQQPLWAGPIVGASVVPVVLRRYGRFLGADPTPEVLAFGSTLGLLVGTIMSLMDYMEQHATEEAAPSPTVTKILIGITPLCFWIPFLGPAVAFAAIYRTHWFELPESMQFVLNTAFLIGIAVTLVALLILATELMNQF